MKAICYPARDEVFRRQFTLVGSHSLNHNIPEALAAIEAFGPDIARLVSHQMPLEDIATALSGNSHRAV